LPQVVKLLEILPQLQQGYALTVAAYAARKRATGAQLKATWGF
jgi:hypothetical protein